MKQEVSTIQELIEGFMLTSEKQRWILEMIKGPDIRPVGGQPGHYSPNAAINLRTEGGQLTVKTDDVLDLSNADYLVIQGDNLESRISWKSISGMDFKEREPLIQGPRLSYESANRVISFRLGKRAV